MRLLGVAEPKRAQVFPSEGGPPPTAPTLMVEPKHGDQLRRERARVRDVELVDEDLHLIPQVGAVEEFVASKR